MSLKNRIRRSCLALWCLLAGNQSQGSPAGPRRLAFGLVLLLGLSASLQAAQVVVLKDGRQFTLAKPYVKKGTQAVLTLANGSLTSIPLVDIDVAKTAAANAAPIPEAAAPARPSPTPRSPAEAARQKSERKATVVLSDQDFRRGGGVEVLTPSGETKAGPDEGRVTVSNVSQDKVDGGYTIAGSVSNEGKAPVMAISLVVEAVNAENGTITSANAAIAKDNLAPGEKSGFTARLSTDKEAARFKYTPRWQAAPKAAAAASSTADGTGSGTGDAADGSEAKPSPTPTAPPPPPPTPTRPPTPTPRNPSGIASAPTSAPQAGSNTPYVPLSEEPKK